ncbi:hypothetical protein B484DRAFT_394357, partial [Ochromonadaceae sp. CCMP2298]
SAVTASGAVACVVSGDVGVYPGTAITGFPPAVIYGVLDAGNSNAAAAQASLSAAYATAAAYPPDTLLATDLGGMSLPPGVYKYAAAAALNGVLTLDAAGDPAAQWTFQIGSALLFAAGSSVHFK